MNRELLINLGSGTQAVREAEQLDIPPHVKRRDYFCQFCCVVFGLAPGTFKSHRSQQGAKILERRGGTRQPEGGSDGARLLIETFDLLIVKISISHESASMCQISHRGGLSVPGRGADCDTAEFYGSQLPTSSHTCRLELLLLRQV